MGRRFTVTDKPSLQKKLHEYEKRRKRYRQEGISTFKITKAISNTKQSLKNIEDKQEKVVKIAKLVEEFTNFALWGSNANTSKKAILAKGLFCKYGVERGLGGITISWYLGTKNPDRPSFIRQSFQRSFKNNPEHLKQWLLFKQFLKQADDKRLFQVYDT